jgi:hypothetical protein
VHAARRGVQRTRRRETSSRFSAKRRRSSSAISIGLSLFCNCIRPARTMPAGMRRDRDGMLPSSPGSSGSPGYIHPPGDSPSKASVNESPLVRPGPITLRFRKEHVIVPRPRRGRGEVAAAPT